MEIDSASYYHQNIQQATHYLERYLDKTMRLEDIAKEAGISTFHFHRIFKAIKGEPVGKHIKRLRLEKAANLIYQSKDEISSISLQCGYANLEVFSRTFKSYFGLSPSEYRHQIHSKKNELNGSDQKLKEIDGLEEPYYKSVPVIHMVYIRHTGSYEFVGTSFQKLMLWASTRLALKLKPVTFGIVYDNPEITEADQLRYDACLITSRPIKGSSVIASKTLEPNNYVVFRYRGRYDNFYEVYDHIYRKCIFDLKLHLADSPALEWYIKSPPFYKPEEYVTDFYIPIK